MLDYQLRKPEHADGQLWRHFEELAEAFRLAVRGYLTWRQWRSLDKNVSPDICEQTYDVAFSLRDDAATHFSAAGPFREVPHGWPEHNEAIDFCGVVGSSALEMIVGFASMAATSRIDDLVGSADDCTIEKEAALLLRRADIEAKEFFSGQADKMPWANKNEAHFTDTESNILEALGVGHMTGPVLLKKAGYDYSSHYRGILSNLVKRDILGNDNTGYFRRAT